MGDVNTLLFIASDVRSGSTLLDQLLGAHKQIQSVGELHHLDSHIKRKGPGWSWGWKCSCGDNIDTCPFWFKIQTEIKQRGVLDWTEITTCSSKDPNVLKGVFLSILALTVPSHTIRRWLMGLLYNLEEELQTAIVRNEIVTCAFNVSGCHLVVDSSKNPNVLMGYTLLTPRPRLKVIHLIRDGRAVSFSKNRRHHSRTTYSLIGFMRGITSWLYKNSSILAVLKEIPAPQKLEIRYEDLCVAPRRELKKICVFLNIPYSDTMSQIDRIGRHNIGGSPSRFDISACDIRLDIRWSQNLRTLQKTIYALLVGWFGRQFGYPVWYSFTKDRFQADINKNNDSSNRK
ncbi:sulfotransferase family protein [Desulfocapsa sulfexigens DSM 10523]|uniref:Sulfotransferase family protein n=1 Tax=Desulfocapsa sulfexigens (strain DSM 10523 / SB164P1) TaxID=1167006 RepID=M1P4E8_DESSD|nr:sulfotransferase family protein [Desulfocapsa sulfexigens DSM 10523]